MDRKNISPQVYLVQKQVQVKPIVTPEIDEETIENMEAMCLYREQEIKHIEQELQTIHKMYQEVSNLVQEQQSDIEQIGKRLTKVEKHTKNGEKSLTKAEADQPRCTIL